MVAPHAGAGIETHNLKFDGEFIMSPPTRGRELKLQTLALKRMRA